MKKRIIAVIPARYQSTRYPGKPLAQICGKPMIQWVYEKLIDIYELSGIFIATDDHRIAEVVRGFNGNAIMTGEFNSGTDRVYEVIKDIDCDIVLNIQGDEPLIKKEMIRELISAFDNPRVKMATLKKEIYDYEEISNPNIAKVLTDTEDNAIYFSRSIIPYKVNNDEEVRYYKHIGVYGYTKEFLREFISLPPSNLEIAEKLEQLRAIENGYKIKVIETKYDSIGVDLPEHIKVIETKLKNQEGKFNG